MQNQLGINIPLSFPIFILQRWLKDADKPGFLQMRVEIIIPVHKSYKKIRFLYMILIKQVFAKTKKIQFPTNIQNGEIDVLTINKCVIILFLHIPILVL